VLPSPSTLIER